MKRETIEYVRGYITFVGKESVKTMGILFSVMAVITTFISVDEILDMIKYNVWFLKIAMLLGICAVSIIWNIFLYKRKKSLIVYEKERTSIQFGYGDMQKNYIKNNEGNIPYTVVIPIDTELDGVFDEEKIRKDSNHGYWIKQMKTLGYKKTDIVPMIKRKMQANSAGTCEQGTVCYLTNLRGGVNYLLAATVTLDKNNNHFFCSREQYYIGIHKIIKAIGYLCSHGEKVYMPLIGSGYARMGKTEGEMLPIMEELLIFNADKLNQEIHVILYEKRRKVIPIFSLLKK